MKNLINKGGEVDKVVQEFHEFQNPQYDNEWGFKLNETLFDVEDGLRQTLGQGQSKEDFEDNTPLDENGIICVDRFFDFKTGKLKKDTFNVYKEYKIGEKIYSHIFVPTAGEFVVDFNNRKSFPGLEAGLKGGHIDGIESFGGKEVMIFGTGMDNTVCIDEDGKQIGPNCLLIQKIKYGNIDLLKFTERTNPDYDQNDFRKKISYYGSDGLRYKQKTKGTKDGSITFYEKIENILDKKEVINI